jgi:hypothetical protein
VGFNFPGTILKKFVGSLRLIINVVPATTERSSLREMTAKTAPKKIINRERGQWSKGDTVGKSTLTKCILI